MFNCLRSRIFLYLPHRNLHHYSLVGILSDIDARSINSNRVCIHRLVLNLSTSLFFSYARRASSLTRIAARWPRAPVNKRLSSDARKKRIHRGRLVSVLPSSSCPLTLALDLSLWPSPSVFSVLPCRIPCLSFPYFYLPVRLFQASRLPVSLPLFPLRLRVPLLRGLKINYKKSPRRELETSFHELRTRHEGHGEEGQGKICPPMNFLARERWPDISDRTFRDRLEDRLLVVAGLASITTTRIEQLSNRIVYETRNKYLQFCWSPKMRIPLFSILSLLSSSPSLIY